MSLPVPKKTLLGARSHDCRMSDRELDGPLAYRPSPGGLRNIVNVAKLFIVFVCVSLLAMNAWLVIRARAAEISQITLANMNLGKAVGQHVEGSINEAEHILAGLVAELERADITTERLHRMQPTLVGHVSQIEALKALFFYDAEGRWIVNSEAGSDPARNNADRDYFIHHQQSPSAQPFIGAPIVSRTSGEWVIPVSRRVNDADGRFAGVLLATLSVNHLRAVLDQFQIGAQGAIALFHSDVMLLRRPFFEAQMGRRNTGSPLQKLFQAQRFGTVEAISTIDGVQRIITFEHMRDHPVLVTIAVGTQEALAEWRSASLYQSVWTLLLCLIIVAAGSYLVRSMREREAAEQGLRQTGDALAGANAQLAQLAAIDGLTGLTNRRHFDTRLNNAFTAAQQDASPLAIVMVDVDAFKSFNDLYGHVEGDACLRRVATAVSSAARRTEDVVARYGGEEMIFLLPQTDLEGGLQVAEAARMAVLALEIAHDGSALGWLTVSLGVAAWSPRSQDVPVDLVKAADAALYRAKHNGRNCTRPHES